MPDIDKLLSAIEEREDTAYGADSDPSSVERSRAIDYYLGRPFGNEVEGRSQVVSKDVSDTIEWIKPSLLNIFAGGDEVCKFDPVGPEDEEAAAQETDYVNYVVQKKNSWFSICYEWFTDALLTRNAYALAYWEDKRHATLEKYEGLTEDQLVLIANDPEVEIVAHNAYPAQPLAQLPVDPMTGAPMQPPMLHDVDVRRVNGYACVKISVLPPERCKVAESTRSVSVRDADFFEYWEQKSISDLRSMGYDVPDDIDDSGASETETLIDQARNIDQQARIENDVFVDPAMRKVTCRWVWIKHDYDEDGISEYRHCAVVGKTFLWNEEVEGVPVATIVPTPLPHRHQGHSVYDAINDLQLIKSAMLRQIVDNTYLQNNGRYAISDKVNLDDMLTSRPGGVVRVKGGLPGNEIMPLQHPFFATQAINVVEYIDQIRQNRTGTSNYFTGVDQNALNKTAAGTSMLQTAAAQRVELIARVFAEGVKELVHIVHELTLKHSTSQEKVKLRGKWTTVDPRQWKNRYDMTISVGLGAGNRQSQLAALSQVLALQKEALPYGLTTPSKIYAALTEFSKAAGFTSGEKFWNDPAINPPPPQQPDPKLMIEAERVNLEKERLGFDQQKFMAEHGFEREYKTADLALKRDIAVAEVGVEQEGLRIEDKKAELSATVQLQSKQADLADNKEARMDARKPVEDGTKKVMDAISALAEKQQEASSSLAEAVKAVSEAAKKLTAPKRIVRDAKGKAVGVETVQ